MQNSKRTPIFSKQMQLFNEKNFKHVPLVKMVKVEQNQPQEEVFHESSAEDIFQQMGKKDKIKEQSSQKKSSDDQTQASEWKQYYNRRLKQLKVEKSELNHNQLTQIISEEWKEVKKQLKKPPTTSIQEDFLSVSKAKLKKMKCNNKIQEQKYFVNDCDSDIDFTYTESVKFVETLRSKTLKLVINEISYELQGKAIIEAISNDSNLIYLNETLHNSNTKVQTPNEKSSNRQQIGSDSELSICKGSDDFLIQNKIRSFL